MAVFDSTSDTLAGSFHEGAALPLTRQERLLWFGGTGIPLLAPNKAADKMSA